MRYIPHPELLGINIGEPIKDIYYKDLEKIEGWGERFRRVCPECKHGYLFVKRESNFVLEKIDNCILCGQHFRYLDIEEMRREDRAGEKKRINRLKKNVKERK